GLTEAGTPAGFLSDYLTTDETKQLVSVNRRRFRRVWRHLASSREFSRVLRWEGVLLEAVARPLLRGALGSPLGTALLSQEAASRAMDTLAPRAVVLTANRRFTERALALAARQRGIPVLLFSNALVMPRDRTKIVDIADRLLVSGRHLREHLINEQ